MTLVAGAALCEALRRATGLPIEIKWPNDLLVGGRKLCGILAEAFGASGTLQHVVLGFGINLRPAAFPRDLADRATSVEGELGRRVDRGTVLAEALASLAECYAHYRSGRFAAILVRWRALAPSSIGVAVRFENGGRSKVGTTAGIDAEGALLVRTADGVERVIAGEVTWIGATGRAGVHP